METELSPITWPQAIHALKTHILSEEKSPNTVKNYVAWCRNFQQFVGGKSPGETGAVEADAFLHHIRVERKLSRSSQRQASVALRMLCRHVLGTEPYEPEVVVSIRPRTPPINVLTATQIKGIIALLDPPYSLIAQLTYGCGLHLTECMTLRLACFDMENRQIKLLGDKGILRVVPLPRAAMPAIRRQIAKVVEQCAEDNDNAFLGAFMTDKFRTCHNADPKSITWQFLFPAISLTTIKPGFEQFRSHLTQSAMQKEMARVVKHSRIKTPATPRVLRHSCCLHLLAGGCKLREVQALMGHGDIRTTQAYLKLLPRNEGRSIASPLDWL